MRLRLWLFMGNFFAGALFCVGFVLLFTGATGEKLGSTVAFIMLFGRFNVLAIMEGIFSVYCFPMGFSWGVALKMATAVVRQRTRDTLSLVTHTEANDTEWETTVVPELTKLAETVLPAISEGLLRRAV